MSDCLRMPLSTTLSVQLLRTRYEVLGATVLDGLYAALKSKYDITRDELPYRTETMYQILEGAFGVFGAKTIGF